MAAVPSVGRASEVEAAAAPNGSAATRDLYDRYARQVYRYCYGRLRSREEAEDATQTVFLNAFRGLRRGVMPEVEQAWVYKIAENVCLTRVRSNVRRLRVESPADLEPLHEVVAAPAPGEVDLEALQDALARLPEQQRRAILLREWQGLSYAEIASELGISQSAVEALIFRARRSLAKELRDRENGGILGKIANVGSVAGWLKSILLGGSTAAKVATLLAAGAAVAIGSATNVTQHHSKPAKDSAKLVPAAPLARMPVIHRPPVGAPARGRKADPMRLAPVRAVVGGGESSGEASVAPPVYRPGRAERPETARAGTTANENVSATTPTAPPVAAGPVEPKTEKPAKSAVDETKPETAKEHPVVPGPNEHAAPPATAPHPDPAPPPTAGPKEKKPQPDAPAQPQKQGSGDE